MSGPGTNELGSLAWGQVSALARSSAGLFDTREGRLATAAVMARAILKNHEGSALLEPSALDDLSWVAAGGDPLDPTDGFLGGRPSLRSTVATHTVAALLATLSGNPPGANI